MPEPTNQDLLNEIKKLNEKIDQLNANKNESKRIPTPLALIGLFLGFAIIGPIVGMLIMTILE